MTPHGLPWGDSGGDMPDIKVAIIGLDTSHTIEFTKRFQAPDCSAADKVGGVKVINCMRFETPFQNKEGLDKRQKQMEDWGVRVVTDFNEAVINADAIMLEINDPQLHLEYFKKAAVLSKPVYLDKPLADTAEHGSEILKIAKDKKVKVFSTSSLRFDAGLILAAKKIPAPLYTHTYGPLGAAAAGSSIVWYGVHAFEMLVRVMGKGGTKVFTTKTSSGVVVTIEYPEKRRGVVELTENAWVYGGDLRTNDKAEAFVVDGSVLYTNLCKEIANFLKTGNSPVPLEETMEVMALLEAAEKSFKNGKENIL